MKPPLIRCEIRRRPTRSGLANTAIKQQGATLIEVLVAVLLLSFGIVGLAGLQMNGTKFNHGAYLRSQGTALAYDMADRIRANLDACEPGFPCAYDTALAAAFDGNAAQACGLPQGIQPAPPDMAAVDVNQWKNCLETTLPGGQGLVRVLAAGAPLVDQCGVTHNGAGAVVIEVNWTEGRLQGAGGRDCVVVRTDVRP